MTDLLRRPSTWIAAALGLALAVLPHLDTPGVPLIPKAQAVLIPLVIVGAVVAIVFGVFRRYVAGAVLLVGTLVAGSVLPISPISVPADHTPDLTVMTFNLQYSQAPAAQVAELIVEHEVDVVTLLEVEEWYLEGLLSGPAGEQLPYRTGEVAGLAAEGSVILSRYPLDFEFDFAQWYPAGDSPEQPVALVHHPDQTVRVVAVHPWPPIFELTAPWHRALEDLNTWHREEATDYPLVLAGDFNSSNSHPVYRRLAAGLTDTAGVAGLFPQATWPVHPWIPQFTALDHILVRDLQPVSWQTFALPGSDHEGIITGLQLP